MKHPEIVSKMTLAEKARFVSGLDYWHLEGDEQFGLPSIMITDGPSGLRKKNDDPDSAGISLGNSVPSTAFPTSVALGASWDPELAFEEGQALGQECLSEKVSVLLGPGVNIKRSPTCGRNFEYFSEDPYLAGKMAGAWIRGVQSKGVGTSLKHFACNSQEAYRMVINEVVDERALREIYLTAFEIAVKEGKPWTIMNCYNRVNGVYGSESDSLQNRIARGEWGFDGLFVTDWGASVDRVPGIKAGTDLEMPSSGDYNDGKIISAVESGELDENVLDECVDRVVDLIIKSKPALESKHEYDKTEHHKIAQKVAEGSMQLLKNDEGILPLKEGQKVAVIGEMAAAARYQGAGSSIVCPALPVENALDNLIDQGVDVLYARGYDKKKDEIDAKLFNDAVAAAKKADVALVFAGLTEQFEGEGYDRVNIDIPYCHNVLIKEIARVNPNTVVVLAGGSVVRMPWVDQVKGILNSTLGGQAGGIAVANILTGKVNPSGKTTETYILKESDNPTYGNYPAGPVTSEHRESVYIGYRYYDKAKKDVLFPFGHGLSYTEFKYSGIRVSKKSITDDDTVTVSFKVKNTGDVAGAEVAQLYVRDIESTIFRPEKELKGFEKVFLEPGEEKTVKITLDKRAFAFWNVNVHDWTVESGEFEIFVGASSRDIRLQTKVSVSAESIEIPSYKETAPAYYDDVTAISRDDFAVIYGELPDPERDPGKRIDIYSCLDDARGTKAGGALCGIINKAMTLAGGDATGNGQMIAAMATQIPVRNFIAMSMGVFTEDMAEGLLEILNDGESTAKGIGKIFKGIPSAIKKLPELMKSI